MFIIILVCSDISNWKSTVLEFVPPIGLKTYWPTLPTVKSQIGEVGFNKQLATTFPEVEDVQGDTFKASLLVKEIGVAFVVIKSGYCLVGVVSFDLIIFWHDQLFSFAIC